MLLYLIVAAVAALFIIFGLGYYEPLINRLSASLPDRLHNFAFSLGPINVRSQNNEIIVSTTSSNRSWVGDSGQQVNARSLPETSQTTANKRENRSEEIVRNITSFKPTNVVSVPCNPSDLSNRDERDRELYFYGTKHLRLPMAHPNNQRTLKPQSNREFILESLRNSLQENLRTEQNTLVESEEQNLEENKSIDPPARSTAFVSSSVEEKRNSIPVSSNKTE